MSLHCDTDRILLPLTTSQADRLLYGRLSEPDMAKIIIAHRDYDKYWNKDSRVHSGRLNKNKEDVTGTPTK